ncbi:hypothetical protein KAR91_01360 [Candidatus Pacearchaeota archaeon]|nr:hypothetical protein [Candidatus Pacearchaeota archaeon]
MSFEQWQKENQQSQDIKPVSGFEAWQQENQQAPTAVLEQPESSLANTAAQLDGFMTPPGQPTAQPQPVEALSLPGPSFPGGTPQDTRPDKPLFAEIQELIPDREEWAAVNQYRKDKGFKFLSLDEAYQLKVALVNERDPEAVRQLTEELGPEVLQKMKHFGKQAVSFGGKLGTKDFKQGLIEEVESFGDFESIGVDVAGKLGGNAAEWYTFAKLFGLVGKAGKAIGGTKAGSKVVEGLRKVSGLDKLKNVNPKAARYVGRGTQAAAKGYTAGATMQGLENIAKDKEFGEWLESMNKRGLITGAITTAFSVADTYDKYQWLKGFDKYAAEVEAGWAKGELAGVPKGKKSSLLKTKKMGETLKVLRQNMEAELFNEQSAFGSKKPPKSAKEVIDAILKQGVTPETMADASKFKPTNETPGQKSYKKARDKALKDVASGKPKRVAAGKRVLDWLERNKYVTDSLPKSEVSQSPAKETPKPNVEQFGHKHGVPETPPKATVTGKAPASQPVSQTPGVPGQSATETVKPTEAKPEGVRNGSEKQALREAIDRVDDGDDTFDDIIDDIEDATENEAILQAVQDYRDAVREDREEYGMRSGLPDDAEEKLRSVIEQQSKIQKPISEVKPAKVKQEAREWTDSFVDPAAEEYITQEHLTPKAEKYWQDNKADIDALLEKGDDNLSEDETERLWNHYYDFRHMTTARGSHVKDEMFPDPIIAAQEAEQESGKADMTPVPVVFNPDTGEVTRGKEAKELQKELKAKKPSSGKITAAEAQNESLEKDHADLSDEQLQGRMDELKAKLDKGGLGIDENNETVGDLRRAMLEQKRRERVTPTTEPQQQAAAKEVKLPDGEVDTKPGPAKTLDALREEGKQEADRTIVMPSVKPARKIVPAKGKKGVAPSLKTEGELFKYADLGGGIGLKGKTLVNLHDQSNIIDLPNTADARKAATVIKESGLDLTQSTKDQKKQWLDFLSENNIGHDNESVIDFLTGRGKELTFEDYGKAFDMTALRAIGGVNPPKAAKEIQARISGLAKGFPEFTLNPTFTVEEDNGLKYLVFRDHFRVRYLPERLGIDPKGLKVGQTIRFDLESFGIKPASKKALKGAEAFTGKGVKPIKTKVTKNKPTTEAQRKRENQRFQGSVQFAEKSRVFRQYLAGLAKVPEGAYIEEVDITKTVKAGIRADQTPHGIENAILAATKDHSITIDKVRGVIADALPKPKETAIKKASIDPAKTQIQDFGEKLGGARKDYYATLDKAKNLNVAAHPLSKTFPEPDYAKLIEGGKSSYVVSAVRAMRDEIPQKPRKGWKLQEYGRQVETLRGFSSKLLNGEITEKLFKEKLGGDSHLGRIANKIELYEIFGHDVSLKGMEFKKTHWDIYKGEKNVTRWQITQPSKATAFSNMPRVLASSETKEGALEQFESKLDAIRKEGLKPKTRSVKFNVYAYRKKPGTWWIGKKVGKNYIDLKSFTDSKEARAYIAENHDKLVEQLKKAKYIPDVRRKANEERIGEDYRKGEDVTPEMFTETFGLRGVEFGNWVGKTDERQNALNNAYDGLSDLASILKIPTQAISLDGELGLAFGSRGRGGKNPAAAHYEPDKVVINLTRKQGAGSLAHEWWHAIDSFFSRSRKNTSGYMSERPVKLSPNDPTRQVMSLIDRIDRKYINKNNLTAGFYKYRGAAWEFKDGYLNPEWKDKAVSTADDLFWGKRSYTPGENTLAYQMAARQITVGDIGDAADFIKIALDNGAKVSRIKSTLKSHYSPIGPVKQAERNNFYKALGGKEGNEAYKLQKQWESQMHEALKKAQSK